MDIIKSFFFLLLSTVLCFANIEYDGWMNIRLKHTLGPDGSYVDRGNISVQSIRSINPIIEQKPLTTPEVNVLKELSKTDGFYQLHATVTTPDGAESTFLSSIKADTLLSSGLSDSITIWLLHNGSPIFVGISPSNVNQYKATSKFSTDIYIKHIEQAPIPDTASYIQKMEKEKEAREKGDSKDNRSFFAKYWMYIVPVAIVVLVSGAMNPEQPNQR